MGRARPASTPRPRRRIALALLVGIALGLLSLPASSGELSSDDQKWVRSLLDALAANNPSVRRGAESALVAMGIDAVPEIVAAMPLKNEAAKKGALRALRAMGTAKVRTGRRIARSSPARSTGNPLDSCGPSRRWDKAGVRPPGNRGRASRRPSPSKEPDAAVHVLQSRARSGRCARCARRGIGS